MIWSYQIGSTPKLRLYLRLKILTLSGDTNEIDLVTLKSTHKLLIISLTAGIFKLVVRIDNCACLHIGKKDQYSQIADLFNYTGIVKKNPQYWVRLRSSLGDCRAFSGLDRK